jgi:hypothetical protein
MEGAQIRAGAMEGDGAAGIGGRGIGLQNVAAIGLERERQPAAFAKQFGGDVLDADLDQHLQRALQTDQTGEVDRARFVAARIGPKQHLFLRDVIRATHDVPAVNGRAQTFLPESLPHSPFRMSCLFRCFVAKTPNPSLITQGGLLHLGGSFQFRYVRCSHPNDQLSGIPAHHLRHQH